MRVFKLLVFGAAALVSVSQAVAQQAVPCGDRGKLVEVLDGKYHEGLSGFGVGRQGNLVEVFVSESGSFTVIVTNSKGVSCILATGESWEKVSPMKRFTAS